MEPKIRLKGFKGEWKKVLVGKMGTTYSGLSGKTKDDFGIGGARFVTFLNVLTNAIIDTSILEAVNVFEGEHQNEVRKGDLLFNTSSETPEEVGMCAVMNEDLTNVYLNSFCFGFRVTDENIDSTFIAYLMRSHIGRRIMSILAQGATRYNLSKNNFCKAELLLPKTKAEQQQIASYFTSLDTQIALQTQRLEKLKQVKAASLQSMFPQEGETTPRVRFKGCNGEWEIIKFSDFAEIHRGLTYTPNNVMETGVRVLRSSNIDEDTFVTSKGDIFVAPNCVNIDYAKEGDILITAANGSPRLVGKHAIIRNTGSIPMVAGGFMYLVTSQESEFLNASLSSNWYFRFLKTGVAGGNGSIGNLSRNDLKEAEFLIPIQKEERNMLADYFTSLDSQIALQTQILEKLKQIKSACLDNMFV